MEKQYLIYALIGNKSLYAVEEKMWDESGHYFAWRDIDMEHINQMDKGTFKHSYTLKEAERLLKKLNRWKRKTNNKYMKKFTNGIILVKVSKLLKINKLKLKEHKQKKRNKVKPRR